MFMSRKVDVVTLKDLASKSEKAKAILEVFSGRQRGRSSTSYYRLKRVLEQQKNIQLSLNEFKSIFETFEIAGCGKINSKTNRSFDWTWNLASVSSAVLNNSSQIKLQTKKNPKLLKLSSQPVSTQTAHNIVTIKKNDLEIAIDLANMTPAICQKISQLLVNISDK